MPLKLPEWEEVKKRAKAGVEKIGEEVQRRAEEIAADPKKAANDLGDKLNQAGDALAKGFEQARELGKQAIASVKDLRSEMDTQFDRVDEQITKLPETIDGLKQQLANKIENSSGTVSDAVEKGATTVERLSGYLSVRGAIVSIATRAVKNNAKDVIGGASGKLASLIRGQKMAFIDTIVQEPNPRDKLTGVKPDVRAMIFIPGDEKADENGIGIFPERTLLELEQKANNIPEEATIFRKARAAVRDKKAELGVHVQTTLNDDGPDEIVPRM